MTLPEIGRRVKEARQRAALTQAQLAQSSGLSRLTIVHLETGALSDLGVRKLERVLAVLELEIALRHASPLPTLDDLAEEQGSPTPRRRKR